MHEYLYVLLINLSKFVRIYQDLDVSATERYTTFFLIWRLQTDSHCIFLYGLLGKTDGSRKYVGDPDSYS